MNADDESLMRVVEMLRRVTSGTVPGRATGETQKEEVCLRLLELWKCFPELRLSQLIANVYREYDEVRDEGTPIEWRLNGWTHFYNIEDYPFIEGLERFYALRQNVGRRR